MGLLYASMRNGGVLLGRAVLPPGDPLLSWSTLPSRAKTRAVLLGAGFQLPRKLNPTKASQVPRLHHIILHAEVSFSRFAILVLYLELDVHQHSSGIDHGEDLFYAISLPEW